MTVTNHDNKPGTAWIEKIRRRLLGDERVQERFGVSGELHIDRSLPFLCVYRQPGDRLDAGTRSLLHGQAAFLLGTSELSSQRDFSELVAAVAQTQSAAFGSFLLVELWSGKVGGESGERVPEPWFHVHAPQDISNEFVACVENALQEVLLREKSAKVTTEFNGECSPPGLPPLMTPDRIRDLNCVVIGLEVSPVYRDPETGVPLPFALTALSRGLAHALKMIFYRFSHNHTRYYPDHYHELGPRAITDAVLEIDRGLAEISENFDLLLHVTPVNANNAWQEFTRENFGRMPTFHYRPRSVDPALLKRSLYRIPIERAEDPTLTDLFSSKRDELDRQLTLLSDRGTARFIHGSIQLFGQIEERLLNTAKKLANSTLEGASGDAGELLGAGELAKQARDEIAHYRKSDPTLAAEVEVRDDITGILVSHGNFLIGSDAGVSGHRLRATLNHEIGTHALTYHNGKRQPLRQLYAGLAGYEELQEGLAVLAEYLSGGLTLSRLQLLAGRVIAVHSIIQGADFVETFRLLRDEYNFRAFTAFTMTMRVCRGGGYTKDMVYLRGFLNLLEYLAEDRDFQLLFYGKIAMDHLLLLEELRWRKVLQPIALTPRYLEDVEGQRRLEALKSNSSLQHILDNLT